MDDIEIVAVIYEISIAYVIGISFREEKIRRNLQKNHHVFIGDIAHSLQTPLTIAQTELELLEYEVGQRADIGAIRKSLERISVFIHRMLRLARIEGCADAVRESIDLSALVQEEVEYVGTMGEQEGVGVTTSIEPGIVIWGDRKGIVDVVINIAQNAIKYRRTNIASTLHVVLRVQNDSVELSFIDNGIGIDAKHTPYVFDRLYRATDQGEGFGLGLALVKSVLVMHGATIDVVSTFGKGSVFTVRFPSSRRRK